MSPLTPVARAILIAMVAGFALQQWLGEAILVRFALWPLDLSQMILVDGEPFRVEFRAWQLISYALLHGGFAHLLFNGIALWSFAGAVETRLGARRFLILFVSCVVGSAIAQLMTMPEPAVGEALTLTPTVGASGGIYGVLLAFAMFYPRARMMLIFPPIPMPAWLLVGIFITADLALGFGRFSTGIAHFAHLGGALTGVLLVLLWRKTSPPAPRGPPSTPT